MGTITREASAPIADGETASGDEMELEIAKIFSAINGNIEDANIKAAADIDGSKLKDNTVTNAKVVTSSLTTTKFNASAVSKAYVDTSTGTEALTATDATLIDVPDITAATLTAGSTDDMLLCTFNCGVVSGDAVTKSWQFAFSVDGTDKSDCGQVWMTGTGETKTGTAIWMQTVPDTDSMIIKPRYKATSATDSYAATFGGQSTSKVFTVQIIPIKA